jgi:integrase/recombinase XerD
VPRQATFALFANGASAAHHAALAIFLGLNGLRVNEACGTNVEDLGFERGHRTLRIVGKRNAAYVVVAFVAGG